MTSCVGMLLSIALFLKSHLKTDIAANGVFPFGDIVPSPLICFLSCRLVQMHGPYISLAYFSWSLS